MNNKLQTITNLFEEKEIRSFWDSEKEEYYFSVIDVIGALTDNDYDKSRNYWKWLKSKLKEEGSELVSNTNQLKLQSLKDGKFYKTDTLDTKGIFRLIESVPSAKAEPFKINSPRIVHSKSTSGGVDPWERHVRVLLSRYNIAKKVDY